VPTIQLPARLPGNLDLGDINRRLRAGEIDLDWSRVESDVEMVYLRELLAGLQLSQHIEFLGAATIADDLQQTILTILNDQQQEEDEDDGSEPGSLGSTPELWQPAEEVRAEAPEVRREEEKEEALPAEKVASVKKPLLEAPSPAAMRDELETLVIRDLLGPTGGEEEEVDEARLRERYLVGLLAPNESQTPPEELESAGTAEEGSEEQGPIDSDSSQTTSLSPSTLGLSFCVNLEANALLVTASWGHYRRVAREVLAEARGATGPVWKRTPRGGQAQSLPLKEGAIDPWYPEPDEQPEVFVKGIMRRRSNCWMVTLFLVNAQAKPKQLREQAYLFQPELIVTAPDGGPIFQSRPLANERIHKREDRAMAMLYRHEVSFAIGHGVSVHAETRAGDSTSAVRLTTTFVPRYDVPRTEAPTTSEIPALADLCLDMQALAQASMADLPLKLRPLISAYAAWIDTQEGRLADPVSRLEGYGQDATDSLELCRQTLTRISAGIELLASNADAARAFTFTNRAMWLQRIHTLYAEERRRGGTRTLADMDQPANRSWRPFQLAFILLNLPALTDLHHSERSSDPSALADLLWFPTGGGKTEAYLGLTAYTLGIRRLQGTIEGRSGHDGVAVLMRYTLRLLTLPTIPTRLLAHLRLRDHPAL